MIPSHLLSSVYVFWIPTIYTSTLDQYTQVSTLHGGFQVDYHKTRSFGVYMQLVLRLCPGQQQADNKILILFDLSHVDLQSICIRLD